MSDDLGLLRQSLHQLSEQGGEADIHARVLVASRKLRRRRRALALGGVTAAVVAVTVPLALTGTFNRAAPPLPAAPSVSVPAPSTTSPSTTPPSPARSEPATVTRTHQTVTIETSSPPDSGATADDHCPVGSSTLLAARKRNASIDDAILKTGSFSDIDCYQGYAMALSHPTTQGDTAWLVFRYSGGAWSAVNGGTADVCDGVVPADIRRHLENCH